MRSLSSLGIVVVLFATAAVVAADESQKPPTPAKAATAPQATPPTPDEQVAALEAQCAQSAEARGKRHAEKPLFDRLGGEAKIHALTREVVRLHLQNESIKHFFAETDNDEVAKRVAQFVIAAVGGPTTAYKGPSLSESHADMKLTNADFLAAGGDVIQGMKNLGYGQNEIDEVICALVALRPQVILPKEKPPQKP